MGPINPFQSNIESQLDQWHADMDENRRKIQALKAKAERLEGEAKVRYLEQIRDLESKMEAVRSKLIGGQKQLDNWKSIGQEAWRDVKVGGHSAWNGMVDGMNKAWGKVKTSVTAGSSKIHDRTKKK